MLKAPCIEACETPPNRGMSSPQPPAIKSDAPQQGALPMALKLDSIERDDGDVRGANPPALPPRPPPRPRAEAPCRGGEEDGGIHDVLARAVLPRSCWLRKYVFLCTVCGGLAVLLGALFLTVYFMLRSYTSSLHYFETIPTYIPASMLMITGVMVMSLAGRRNRYSYLIKLCGACCLLCAVVCVTVTVTTTVFHMSRLQSLRECVFTQKTLTCTCYSVLLDSTTDRGDEGVRYIFNATPDCEVIHGALYSCLRAMFGLSVIGILVCIFSCMLVYQLLSHEKKKMYWEQLELRCRYLSHAQRAQHCACCAECRHPPGAAASAHEMFPWELDERYWSPRVGNLYSPNPGAMDAPLAARRSAWSWRRLPWSRTPASPVALPVDTVGTTGCMSANPRSLRHSTASPDSQYGFSSRHAPSSPGAHAQAYPVETAQSFYTWGPPPPYSSPCRQQPLLNLLRQRRDSQPGSMQACHGRRCSATSAGSPQHSTSPCRQPDNMRGKALARVAKLTASPPAARPSDDYVNTEEVAVAVAVAGSVVRKTKKMFGARAPGCPMWRDAASEREESEGYEGLQPPTPRQCCHASRCCRDASEQVASAPTSPRIKYLEAGPAEGVANEAFDATPRDADACAESEVYFGDVSSCCNASVRTATTDGHDSFIYDEAVDVGHCHTYHAPSAHLTTEHRPPDFHPHHLANRHTHPDHLHHHPDASAPHHHLYTSPTFPHPHPRPRPPHPEHEDAVLRSHCFTYQMFAKRPWEDAVDEVDAECASCSTSEPATPGTEHTDSTFVSPGSPGDGGDPLAPFYLHPAGDEGVSTERDAFYVSDGEGEGLLAPDAQYARSLGPGETTASEGDGGALGDGVMEGEEGAQRRLASVRTSGRKKEADVVRSVNV